MRVKTSGIRNLYVLVVYAPRSSTKVAARRTSPRPFAAIERGDVVRAGGGRLRATRIASRVVAREDAVEHITEVYTRGIRAPRAGGENVVEMPSGDHSVVAQFLRYHVLVRVFDGDPDAWLEHLEKHGGDGGDLRFVRWVRSRLRQDPSLLASIRRMVDATPFWRAAEA